MKEYPVENFHESSLRSNGFSLIELLAALSVVMILAAILIPTINSVVAHSRLSTNTSNLRMINQAALLWSQENKGAIVPTYDPGDGGAHSFRIWTGLLAPYLGWQLERTYFEGVEDMPVYVNPTYPDRWGYGHNYYGLRFIIRNPDDRFYNEDYAHYANISDPSRIVFFTTSLKTNSAGESFRDNWRGYVRPVPLSQNDLVVDFSAPGNTAVVLWLDGHITTETREKLNNMKLWGANWRLQ